MPKKGRIKDNPGQEIRQVIEEEKQKKAKRGRSAVRSVYVSDDKLTLFNDAERMGKTLGMNLNAVIADALEVWIKKQKVSYLRQRASDFYVKREQIGSIIYEIEQIGIRDSKALIESIFYEYNLKNEYLEKYFNHKTKKGVLAHLNTEYKLLITELDEINREIRIYNKTSLSNPTQIIDDILEVFSNHIPDYMTNKAVNFYTENKDTREKWFQIFKINAHENENGG